MVRIIGMEILKFELFHRYVFFISYRFSETNLIHDKRAWHISRATERLNHSVMVSSMDREAYHNSRSQLSVLSKSYSFLSPSLANK